VLRCRAGYPVLEDLARRCPSRSQLRFNLAFRWRSRRRSGSGGVIRGFWNLSCQVGGETLVSQVELEKLLGNTASLFSHIYHFECSGVPFPGRTRRGAAIAYSDLGERRPDFVRELRSSIVSWVYSSSRFSSMLEEELKERGYDMGNAVSHIIDLAHSKFRSGFPRGQFGELLLFNFLQHFFKAPALLRKMPLTTNVAVERHGADAIHLGLTDGKPVIFLGEAKTYTSNYKFATALEAALASIVKAHSELMTELDLYVYDEFIEEPLRSVAKDIKRNKVEFEVQLVSIVSYTETKKVSGANQAEIDASLEAMVVKRIGEVKKELFDSHNENVLARMHFFFLPFWDLESLLKEFEP